MRRLLAVELYRSPLRQACRAHARLRAAGSWCRSAKYGVGAPYELIGPLELARSDLPATHRRCCATTQR